MSCRLAGLAALAALLVLPTLASAEVTVEQSDDGVSIAIDGKPFARYVTDVRGTPAVWPILGPTGKPMTRAYPMDDSDKSERQDHPHHRSLWFNHGSVNGLSFWDKDTIKHREFVKVAGGAEGLIITRNDWLARDGKRVLEDERRLVFGGKPEQPWIDFTVTLKASDGPVTFGDTKEGSFGIRVAETMKVDAKLGGRIVNSAGDEDGAAWAKRADWVDYQGPVDGQTLGIAVLNHPSSFRYPTFWHVRTYGLFAANPFGVKDFTGSGDGSYTLEPGKTMTLRYRVIFHKGDEREAKIAEAFKKFAAE